MAIKIRTTDTHIFISISATVDEVNRIITWLNKNWKIELTFYKYIHDGLCLSIPIWLIPINQRDLVEFKLIWL